MRQGPCGLNPALHLSLCKSGVMVMVMVKGPNLVLTLQLMYISELVNPGDGANWC